MATMHTRVNMHMSLPPLNLSVCMDMLPSSHYPTNSAQKFICIYDMLQLFVMREILLYDSCCCPFAATIMNDLPPAAATTTTEYNIGNNNNRNKNVMTTDSHIMNAFAYFFSWHFLQQRPTHPTTSIYSRCHHHHRSRCCCRRHS